MKKIMLIDGHSVLNRAFHGVSLLTNAEGEYTNAVYGFLTMLFKNIDDEAPDCLIVAFDLPRPTFRHLEYGGYKGGRKAMPEELRPQAPLLRNLLKKMGVCVREAEGFEADDVLGTLAVKAEAAGLAPVIITGDRDLLQLATDAAKVRITRTKGGKAETEDFFAADMVSKFGVTPKQFIDVKALMGDASDNIPGVPGIGEKTAYKLIQEHGSLENVLAYAEETDEAKPKKIIENLRTYAEQAVMSKRLATIVTDVPVEADLAECAYTGEFGDEAREEILRLGFKSLTGRFQGAAKSAPGVEGVEVIRTREDAARLAERLCAAPLCAFVTLTDGDRPLAVSFACDGVKAVLPVSEPIEGFLEAAAAFFEGNTPKLTMNSKREMSILYSNGVSVEGIIFDASIAGYVLNAAAPPNGYDDIARAYLNESRPSEEDFWGKGKNRRKFSDIPESELYAFAAAQADTVFRAYPVMTGKLDENGQTELYRDIDFPLARVLFEMEQCGIKVDGRALAEYGAKLDARCAALAGEIHGLAGRGFNINSPSQLGDILFEDLGLKGGKKTKTGYSTAADVLDKLKDKHPIVPAVLEYRAVSKLKSTYVDGFLPIISPLDGKVRSTFNQTVAATGRLSSTEPNLQNIPVRTELGRELRKVFIPTDDNYTFMDADYSQIELRILAHMSGDETLINAFRNGEDIHRLTASQVLSIPPGEVTPEQRRGAKAVNFGIIYGISAYSLSEDIGVSVREAEEYMSGYFARYPAVKAYMAQSVAEARENGFARTLWNRRREIPELDSSNFNLRSFGERVAMNMPIQGSAADIIKIAMIRVRDRLLKEGLKTRLVLQVHDELVLEVYNGENERAALILREEMEGAAELAAPLSIDLHEGKTWFDAK